MSQIIDQGVDFEVEMLTNTQLQKMRAQFVVTEGDNPLEKEEVTDGQLSCLYHKLQSGQPCRYGSLGATRRSDCQGHAVHLTAMARWAVEGGGTAWGR